MAIIHFTPSALDAIDRYRSSLHIPEGHFLRIGIRQKNEATKRLLIGFDEKGERDQLAIVQGIELIYSPGEVFFFAGMAIDFVEQENRKGFTFVEQKSIPVETDR